MRLKQRAQPAYVDGAVGQRITRARPAAAETRAQAQPDQRPPLRATQHRIGELDGAEARQQLRIDHKPKRDTFTPKPEAR